jgi:hypothetical protein
MEEVRFPAGNVIFAVRELHTRQGDGVSVDILADAVDQEVSIIRLDWFPKTPHYHYNPKPGRNPEMPLDPALIGDSMDWFLERIPDRLPAMVNSAGHPDVAKAIDRSALTRVLPEVKNAAQQARRECGAQE